MGSHRNGTLVLLVSAVLSALVTNVSGYGIDDRLEINLLESLTLTDRMNSVVQVPGLHGNSPAFFMQDTNRFLELPDYVMEKAANLLRSTNEFTLIASIKQDVRNSGSLFAISEGRSKYLELHSSTRRDEIKFLYRSNDAVYTEKFEYPIVPEKWTKIALTVSGTHLSLFVNCEKVYERVILKPDLDLDTKNLVMYLGQRSEHAYFKGMLQDVKLVVASHGYLTQCPDLERQCPTCGEYQEMVEKIAKLSGLLQAMENRVIVAEQRISELEECNCQKPCEHNGQFKPDGERWTEGCQECTCSGGNVECEPKPCGEVSCKHPVIPDGECCPVCGVQCSFGRKLYDDGEVFSPAKCRICRCENGFVKDCRIQTCPTLDCPVNQQLAVSGECCKFCRGVDYCQGNNCHSNATCRSISASYTCQCNDGFIGDGRECQDINECENFGGPDGHHCNENAVCVNVPGSYKCECPYGYKKEDDYTCIEQDECADQVDECHEHAQCINTVGSYKCQCFTGYEGNGFYCQAKCSKSCKNGGLCAAPDTCRCPAGYIGDQCQTDIDECASGIDNCHSNSECINLPGSYYCQCKTGYHSDLLPHTGYGATCQDIDECSPKNKKGHTCHSDMTCVNEEGGYQCQCNDIDQCHGKCMYKGQEKHNGEKFKPDDKCYSCTCKDGKADCKPDVCDCSSDTVDLECCSHCNFNGQCLHQENPVVYDSGDKWTYQCQTCQCQNGRIDCVDKSCADLPCEETVSVVGRCCPLCIDDVCSLDISEELVKSDDDNIITCVHEGGIYADGDRWKLEDDACIECTCRRGRVCCSFNPAC
ncbi:protein kinase C-binding protein NELL2-like isoform X2 [Ptychodera flava]|uniref:protein kinase C-binding protein NELL2-like isoform X2 n=1 Tax=Ptychodera flava TaxID=63121 RepID=UPI00396A7B93